MVLILDGDSEHVAHAWIKIRPCEEKKIWFVTALDLIKWLMCAPIPELRSYHLLGTMKNIVLDLNNTGCTNTSKAVIKSYLGQYI